MLPVLKGLLGLGAIATGLSATRKALAEETPLEDEVCACLEAPDCSTICQFGGYPQGAGSQACVCLAPPGQNLEAVCYSGDFSDLKTWPNRALSGKDGGSALNTLRLNGYELTLNVVNPPEWMVCFSVTGKNFDKTRISDCNMMVLACDEKVFIGTANGYKFRCGRDSYGRLTSVLWGS